MNGVDEGLDEMNPTVMRLPLGNITHFEHVNLRIPDHRLAALFFLEGLGFTRDPTRMVGVRNMWVNVGIQQFHLPIGPAQPFAGEIGLTVGDLAAAVVRLAGLDDPQLRASDFSLDQSQSPPRLTSPWGHQFRLHNAGELSGRLPQGIPYVRFFVPPQSCRAIASFYETVLGAPCALGESGDESLHARVNVGVDQYFEFVEHDDLALSAHPNHVAIYTTHYDSIYQKMTELGLVRTADRREQFRFFDIVDLSQGQVVYSIEHEVRSLYHPDYRKPLVNRKAVPYLVD